MATEWERTGWRARVWGVSGEQAAGSQPDAAKAAEAATAAAAAQNKDKKLISSFSQ